jgi:hypothetical protein
MICKRRKKYPRAWEEGKKISWPDFIKAIKVLVKCRF